MKTFQGFLYNSTPEMIEKHEHDFGIYMLDAPPDKMAVLVKHGLLLGGYVGSAGANATRAEKEAETLKKQDYIPSSFGARYRPGSYTKISGTRKITCEVLVLSRNTIPSFGSCQRHPKYKGFSSAKCKEGCSECQKIFEERNKFLTTIKSAEYKREERRILGYIEYRLFKYAQSIGLSLLNAESPVHESVEELENLNDQTLFQSLQVEGHCPVLIEMARYGVSDIFGVKF